MSLVSKPAPGFTAKAAMPDGSIKPISLSDYKGKYVALFFYPFDFTFVCPSEILAFHHRSDKFAERNCQLLGVSIDSHHVHRAWRGTALEDGGIGNISFPLVADVTKEISTNYGVLLPAGMALRGFFLIDPDGVVQHELVNKLPIGRNADEAVRTLDAARFAASNPGQVCPAGWTPGKAAMGESADGVKTYLANYGEEL